MRMRHATAMIIGAIGVLAVTPLVAADLGAYRVPSTDGVPCDSPAVESFDSVILGHFSGGRSYYQGIGGATVLDWRDEKLCFPTRRSCGRFIQSMRRSFHHPEGYFTCLTIR